MGMVTKMSKSNHFWVASGVTFVIFFTEALIHYNYGIMETKNEPFQLSNFTFPKGKSLAKMMGIVVTASTLSGYLITALEQKL